MTIREFKLKKYSEQLRMIPDADCLGFDKESIYSDLGFDKESYRAYLRSILRSAIKSCPFLQKLYRALFWYKTLRRGI